MRLPAYSFKDHALAKSEDFARRQFAKHSIPWNEGLDLETARDVLRQLRHKRMEEREARETAARNIRRRSDSLEKIPEPSIGLALMAAEIEAHGHGGHLLRLPDLDAQEMTAYRRRFPRFAPRRRAK